MEDPKSSSRMVHVDQDLNDFAERAARHNPSTKTAEFALHAITSKIQRALAAGSFPIERIPRRYALHLLLLLFVPLALAGQGSQPVKSEPTVSAKDVPHTPLWQQEQRPFTLAAVDVEPAPISALTVPSADGDLLGPTMLSTRNDIQLPQGSPSDLSPTTPEVVTDTAEVATDSTEATTDTAEVATDSTEATTDTAEAATDTVEAMSETLEESLETTQPEGPPVFIGQITVELANLRNGPGVNYDKVGALDLGAPVTALARHEDWLEVQTDAGQAAWLYAELVDLPSELIQSLPEAQNIPAPPPELVATVAEDNLNLRDGPNTSYIGMTKLSAGTRLDLVARYGEWFRVVTEQGESGWVSSEYLSMVEGVYERVPETDSIPPENPALVGLVTENNVNLRGGPNTKYNSLGKLDAGVELEVVAQHKDWYQVVTPRGTKGWIWGDLLDMSAFVKRRIPATNDIPELPKPKPKARPSRSGGGAPNIAASGDVASLAWQFVGYRYVWGGESPRVGFDCSGLTKYVYSLVGVRLPHNSRAQFSTRYGAVINDMGSLRAGDLVFFVNTAGPGISHVGIYVGDGKVVHATTPRTGVIVSNIWDRYWVSHFYAGLRPYR